MAIIIREFRCGDCGHTFESSDPVETVACPACSAEEAERVFLTPPSIKSPQTSRKDEIVKDLAQSYGMSDLNNKDGAAAKRPTSPQPPQFQSVPNMQMLGNIKPEYRDSFSPFRGRLSSPNSGLAAAGFPFQKRERLKPA